MINNIEDAERVLKFNGYNLYHLGNKEKTQPCTLEDMWYQKVNYLLLI